MRGCAGGSSSIQRGALIAAYRTGHRLRRAVTEPIVLYTLGIAAECGGHLCLYTQSNGIIYCGPLLCTLEHCWSFWHAERYAAYRKFRLSRNRLRSRDTPYRRPLSSREACRISLSGHSGDVFSRGEIRRLRRLMREGSPERISRS